MKSILFKTIILLNILFVFSCKAQTSNDYITFYNDTISKLNTIIPNKTQFYGQPFSNFYNELQSKNINIIGVVHDTKVSPSTKYYVVDLFLCDMNMLGVASQNSYHDPRISITFQDEIPQQIESMVKQYHAQWNPTIAQFLSNLKIEKIKFIGVRGYDSDDYSAK
ncbi:hypothetical protein [uncultured Chryseobacterium sp.]|uniref:hypothetical protein n=1 Tax=uncultured Chryseobacterium sp. TaxID=259322 RepID=UPI002627C143|nr:hypothetical protein [uncultured Chryseobacterium sp.]